MYKMHDRTLGNDKEAMYHVHVVSYTAFGSLAG